MVLVVMGVRVWRVCLGLWLRLHRLEELETLQVVLRGGHCLIVVELLEELGVLPLIELLQQGQSLAGTYDHAGVDAAADVVDSRVMVVLVVLPSAHQHHVGNCCAAAVCRDGRLHRLGCDGR